MRMHNCTHSNIGLIAFLLFFVCVCVCGGRFSNRCSHTCCNCLPTLCLGTNNVGIQTEYVVAKKQMLSALDSRCLYYCVCVCLNIFCCRWSGFIVISRTYNVVVLCLETYSMHVGGVRQVPLSHFIVHVSQFAIAHLSILFNM